mmetsp:Transcript_30301/g.92675  ORF Transcript_30301/g.92675 Transcript_30301/m.92675 type:complete len:228 (-) Transcript_30301:470-1153(-)
MLVVRAEFGNGKEDEERSRSLRRDFPAADVIVDSTTNNDRSTTQEREELENIATVAARRLSKKETDGSQTKTEDRRTDPRRRRPLYRKNDAFLSTGIRRRRCMCNEERTRTDTQRWSGGEVRCLATRSMTLPTWCQVRAGPSNLRGGGSEQTWRISATASTASTAPSSRSKAKGGGSSRKSGGLRSAANPASSPASSKGSLSKDVRKGEDAAASGRAPRADGKSATS